MDDGAGDESLTGSGGAAVDEKQATNKESDPKAALDLAEVAQREKERKEREAYLTSGTYPFEAHGPWMELAFVAVMGAYLAVWQHGKRQNDAIAAAVGRAIHPLYEENFTTVGESDPEVLDHITAEGLAKEGHAAFRLRAAGRRNCLSSQATVSLRKRHEALSLYLGVGGSPMHDELELNFLLPTAGPESQFVFAVTSAATERSVAEANPDIKRFAPAALSAADLGRCGFSADTGFAVRAESKEAVVRLFSRDSLGTMLKKHASVITLVHYSDRGIASDKFPRALRAVIRLPERVSGQSDADFDRAVEAAVAGSTRVLLRLVDHVATFKLGKDAQAACIKRRKEDTKLSAKDQRVKMEEAAQERKAERRRLQLEEVAKMSPEKQAAWKEKDEQKRLKRQQRKFAGKARMVVK